MGEECHPVISHSSVGEGNVGSPSPPYQFTPVAFQLESHIDFIEIFKDGTSLLGSSNINGKVWNGSVWCFDSPDFAPEKNKSFAGFGVEYCVTSGKFVSTSEKILIGDEAGGLSLLEVKHTPGGTRMLLLSSASFAHDRMISAIAPTPDGLKAASSSHDYCLVIWDTSLMEAVHQYRPAHGREVTCVQCQSGDTLFATSSLDGEALLWDYRLSSPASALCKEKKFALTSCEWIRGSNPVQHLVIGDIEGYLAVYDIRQPDLAISRRQILNSSVRSIASANSLIATCGDCPTVAVVDSRLGPVYKKETHPSYGTFVSWEPCTPGRLFSTGKNLSLESHTIESN